MSAYPPLLALGGRLRALGRHALGADVAALGSDLASESTTLRVLERLVARDERLTAAARDAVALLAVAQRTGEVDEAAGLTVLARLRAALGAP